jgi:hypothetical protein
LAWRSRLCTFNQIFKDGLGLGVHDGLTASKLLSAAQVCCTRRDQVPVQTLEV